MGIGAGANISTGGNYSKPLLDVRKGKIEKIDMEELKDILINPGVDAFKDVYDILRESFEF